LVTGIAATLELEAKGYSVGLFEKEEFLGGKTVPYVDESGYSWNHHLLTPDYTYVNALRSRYDPSNTVVPFPISGRSLYTSGLAVFPLPQPSSDVQAELLGFLQFVSSAGPYSSYIYTPGRHDYDNIPPELMVPFSQFMVVNGFPKAMAALYGVITNYGYGYYDTTPAIYLLKYMSFLTLQSVLASSFERYDYHLLLQKIGETLQHVHLAHKVICTRYNYVKKRWQLKARLGKRSIKYQCGKLFMAFPQTLEALQKTMGSREVTDAMEAVFSKVKLNDYHEVVVLNVDDKCPTFDLSQTYSQVFEGFTHINGVPAIYVGHENKGGVDALFLTDLDLDKTTVVNNTLGHLNALTEAASGQAPSPSLSRNDVAYYKLHAYMPHVSTETMQEGFYASLDALQGTNGMYFIGGLLDFELVDSAMNSAKVIVDRFF